MTDRTVLSTWSSHIRLPRSVSAILALTVVGCGAAQPDAEDSVTASPEASEVVILGHDYAFEVPEPVPSGTVHFSFENVGEVPHEVVLVQLNEGVTAERVAEALQGEVDPATLMAGIVGILIADPGTTAIGRLVVELEAGQTYAMLCNFTDTEDAPPHIALGMMRIFEAT